MYAEVWKDNGRRHGGRKNEKETRRRGKRGKSGRSVIKNT